MNEEIKKTIYLVGHPDSEHLDIYEAATPQEAAELYKVKHLEEWGEPPFKLAVWTAIECRPEIDIEEAFDYWGESNPEKSPLEEPWSAYIGPTELRELQSRFDAMVQEIITPYYMADEEVYRDGEE